MARLRALWFRDKKAFCDKRFPGSLYFAAAHSAGMVAVEYFCPCGCGRHDRFRLHAGSWNGSMTEPTVAFEIHLSCEGPARLVSGYWEMVY